MNSNSFSLRRSKTTSSSVGKSDSSIIQLLPFSSHNKKHTPVHSTSHPEAHVLNKKRKTRHAFKDFLILQIPLAFLFLAAKIVLIDDTPVKGTPSRQEVIRTAITFWPYCFAFLVGRATLKFASWRLENGSSVGLLEQLLGSRTLTGTLRTHTKMHYWNWISMCLVLVWCLSPLGGQALIRVLPMVDVHKSSLTNVTYVNTRAGKFILNENKIDVYGVLAFSGFGALFSASILAPISVKNSSVDIWGNVKIPYQSRLSGPADQDGWVAVNTNESSPLIYSSMFGIPTTARFPQGNTSFFIESTYLELNCNQRNTSTLKRISMPKNSWREEVKDPEELLSTNGPFRIPRNISSYQDTTDKSFETLPDDQKDLSGDYGSLWAMGYKGFNASDLLSNPRSENFNTTITTAPDAISSQHFDKTFDIGTLLFQDRTGYKNLTNIFCIPSQRYVESLVTCSKNESSPRTCSVIKQRNSKLPHMPTSVSILAFPRIMHLIGKYLPNAAVLKSETQDFPRADFLTNYLVNQDPTSVQKTTIPHITKTESPLSTLPLNNLSASLGQILNAFLHSTIFDTTRFLTGSSLDLYHDPETLQKLTLMSLSPPSYIPSTSAQEISAEISRGSLALTVLGDSSTPVLTYKVSWPWVVVLFLGSGVMFAAAVSSIVFSYLTIIPEYLGYVSSLVQESRWAMGVEGTAGLDGLERSRLMGERLVRFGDVGGMGEMDGEAGMGGVGVLGIGDLEGTRRVRRGGLYTFFKR